MVFWFGFMEYKLRFGFCWLGIFLVGICSTCGPGVLAQSQKSVLMSWPANLVCQGSDVMGSHRVSLFISLKGILQSVS